MSICPLRNQDCLIEKCALWYRDVNKCAILSLAISLHDPEKFTDSVGENEIDEERIDALLDEKIETLNNGELKKLLALIEERIRTSPVP